MGRSRLLIVVASGTVAAACSTGTISQSAFRVKVAPICSRLTATHRTLAHAVGSRAKDLSRALAEDGASFDAGARALRRLSPPKGKGRAFRDFTHEVAAVGRSWLDASKDVYAEPTVSGTPMTAAFKHLRAAASLGRSLGVNECGALDQPPLNDSR
jgi:hypothetical protein